jgi:hypothetical protein
VIGFNNEYISSWTFLVEEMLNIPGHSKEIPIKEIQIKTALSFHPTPVKMTAIENTNNSKCW